MKMDLSVILKKLQISMEGIQYINNFDSSVDYGCPLAMVLKHIQDMLKPNASEQGVFILGTTEQLFLNAEDKWLFPAIPETELRSIYIDFVKSLMLYAALPVCDTDSGNLPPSFFRDIPGRSCAVSAVMQALLLRLGDTDAPLSQITRNRSLTRALASFMCVFSVTHLQDQPWTSEASKKDALSLLAAISLTIGHECFLDLLCGKTVDDHTGVLKTVLDMLKSELTKENWKRNQATKHVFSWILVQVKRPWLSYYLESVFPPSLLISDDHLLENKVLGVHCLHHIILNVPAADLRQFNRAHVIYHALFNHLYTSEAQLLEVVLPCLLDLLSVLEKPLGDKPCPRKRNRYDQVLCHILTYMEMEDKIALRLLYANTLIPFIERMGIVIVRHLKRLERVIIGYLEISDSPEEKTRLTILAVLEKTIQVAWPRIECRMPVLGRSLLKLLCDVTRETQPPDVRKDLLAKTTHCLQMLDYCSHGKLKGILEEVDNTCANETVLECIKMVTDPPSYELITQPSPTKE